MIILLFTPIRIESQFTRSSHALFNYGLGCDRIVRKNFDQGTGRNHNSYECALLAVRSFATLKIKEIQQVEIFFSLFFFLLFFRNGKKKTRERQGMRWISGTITYENTASGANKGPINYYKEILIFIVRVYIYIYNMYTRGRVMHRDTNNRVIMETLHLRYHIIAYLCIMNEVRFDRVEEREIRRIPIDRVPTQAFRVILFDRYMNLPRT